ncbi:MAG: hypothetical protein EXS36_15970 [Pedosphaera sp.]|nr:hypothetical protein [Pedosphaera sp.]
MKSRPFDVLGLGAVAVDDLIYVDEFPAPDLKVHVQSTARQCGGLAATALVAAARLGARCAYAGTIGTDELSIFALHQLRRESIDLKHIRQTETARVFHSRIIVGRKNGTRNIFSDGHGVVGAAPAWPPAAVIQSTRVLLVDHVGVRGMLRASRIARRAGIPIVGDLERNSGPGFAELFEFVDHLIVSQEFAARHTGRTNPAQEIRRLWNGHRQTVIITDGPRGCWYVDQVNPRSATHLPAFAVEAIDTTGCGDVFHGAYAAALAEGLPLVERIRFSSAAAALKATLPGGQSGIPNRKRLQRFLTSSV